MQVIPLPSLRTEQEVAKALGVSVDTIKRERRRGSIGYTKIGGRPRYTDAQIADYIKSKEVPPCANLKCDPDRALELRDRYEDVRPGYHMNKRHWNTVILDGSLPQADDQGHDRRLIRPRREQAPARQPSRSRLARRQLATSLVAPTRLSTPKVTRRRSTIRGQAWL